MSAAGGGPDVEVLVVGSGAAGLSAALAAVEVGAERVLVAESQTVIGGSSRLSGGLIMGAGTRYQRALGIVDDGDALFRDYMALNRWDLHAGAARRLATMAGPSVEWLGDLGVEFHPDLVYGGDEPVPRVHVPIGRGQAVVDVLAGACRQRGVDIALGQRVDRLLTTGTGQVTGAAVGDDTITAGAVVIASGGFARNPELMAAHFPSAAATGRAWYIGADGSLGDAIGLGRQVGAQLTGHDRGLRLLDSGFDSIYEAYLPGWLLLVNGSGRRFVDETAPYGIMDFVLRQHQDRAFVVFDHATLVAASAAPTARYKQHIPGSSKRQSPHWTLDIVEQACREGRAHRTDSLEVLAAALGLDADVLAGTVHRYNRQVAAGEDADFGKAAGFLEPVAVAPFYGVEVRPATVCFTAFGLAVDRDAAVLDERAQPIAGLFAAGECTGGIVGAQYVGSGNSYANCVTFGRIAGESAARLAISGEDS